MLLLYALLLLGLILLIFFVASRLTCGITRSPVCLIGKTAIVTGGNAGIGYQIALNLASRGCRVIIADKDDATDSVMSIIKESTNPNILCKHINLASFKSIRDFASDIRSTEKRIDILIHNAGVPMYRPIVTEDGINGTFQINYYGPFLLTHLLLDLLKKSSPSRVIFTSSFYAYLFNLKLEDLNPKDIQASDFIPQHKVYSNSKLCDIIAANEFARKLKSYGVTCNSLHPGCVRTNMLSGLRKDVLCQMINLLCWNILINVAGKSSWEGAQTAVHLAVSSELENVTGEHFIDCKLFKFLPSSCYDKKLIEAVWRKSEEITGLKDDEKIL
ncbi:unnamed protein product [Brassicogethes aeneus]|uniref:Retinol dehydrogenase 14 n=1 Tax=Brassicogethes aeneus TaxID=1431903 RepID=A0A9P0B0B9_BRAAE|nr:unnamed protein product [Brassicogethes aeneus]